MKAFHMAMAVVVTMTISEIAQAFPGEGISLEPNTGNYIITYRGDPNGNELSQAVFVPATKISPAIRSSFRKGANESISYRYTVSNGSDAKQMIVSVVLEQIANLIVGELLFPSVLQNATLSQFDAYNSAEAAALTTPAGWEGSISRDISSIGWSPNADTFTNGGILAGSSITGFGFASFDLPGVGISWMAGLANETGDVFGYPDDGPISGSAILIELNQLRDKDYITRPAAVPTIAVPDPFAPALLLDRIRAEMNRWPAKQLLDPAYAAQLDRYMVAAAEAYRLSNTEAGKEHIKTIRKILAKEHHNLDHDDEDDDDTEERKHATRFTIDRLAARVLDFDLRYVLKRMEPVEKEAHH